MIILFTKKQNTADKKRGEGENSYTFEKHWLTIKIFVINKKITVY